MRRVIEVMLCFVPLAAGSVWYLVAADPALPILRFEFAWSDAVAERLVGGRTEAYRDALYADFAFLVGYGGTIVALCLLGLRRGPGRRVLWFGAAAGALAAVLDVVENRLLLNGIAAFGREPGDAVFQGAALAAGVKFALVVPAVVIALWAARRVLAAPR